MSTTLTTRNEGDSMARRARSVQPERGYSIIELLVTLAIFAVVTAMIYSVYSNFLKNAVSERKAAKTELDLVNVSWPLIKEIESAGFGVPAGGNCTPAMSVSAGELIVHSTATGDSQHAGKWSYVSGASCTTTTIPGDAQVVLVNSLERTYIVRTQIKSSGDGLASCLEDYQDAVAYWIPWQGGTDFECSETRYALRDYAADRPAMCAPGAEVRRLSRSVSRTTTTDYQPLLDCVLQFEYRFGCIDATTGNLTWQTGTNCGTAKLRLMKMGVIIQSSVKRDTQTPASITLFEDLDAGLRTTVNLSTAQRNYKWTKREQTIALRNLE